MKIAERVNWMSSDLKNALIEMDFSMLDYQEDAWPFCARHPSDISSEGDLTDLGRECRAYLIANQEQDTAYETEASEW